MEMKSTIGQIDDKIKISSNVANSHPEPIKLYHQGRTSAFLETKEMLEKNKDHVQVTQEQLFEMNLHERINVSDGLNIIRVIGGWIYESNHPVGEDFQMQFNCVFVPEPVQVVHIE